ncbi:MAG: tetratricopeptide repeat protein [Elusimicrobiota bacterium]|nr:MAG: tetratricopeptide repeat protein [Elusimicrobiota bacterium]
MTAAEAGDDAGARAAVEAALKSRQTLEDRQRLAAVWQQLKDWGRAEAALRGLIKEAPKNPGLRLHLACVLALKGDRAETLAELARATALKPDAVDRQRIAFLHADLKDWAPARALLDTLIAEKPGDASLRLDRAAVLARTGPRELGLEDLAAASASSSSDERRRAARLYGEFGEAAKAKAALEALAKDAPADPVPLLDLAELSVKAGDRAGARKALEAALKRPPAVGALRRASAAYLELKDHADAVDAAKRAAELAPRSASPRLDLAAALARSGRKGEALAALSAAEAIGPDLQERQRMALLYQDLGESERARGMLEALIAAQPADPQLRLGLAFFEADAGSEKGARAALAAARARALDPDDSARAAALEERLAEKAAAPLCPRPRSPPLRRRPCRRSPFPRRPRRPRRPPPDRGPRPSASAKPCAFSPRAIIGRPRPCSTSC